MVAILGSHILNHNSILPNQHSLQFVPVEHSRPLPQCLLRFDSSSLRLAFTSATLGTRCNQCGTTTRNDAFFHRCFSRVEGIFNAKLCDLFNSVSVAAPTLITATPPTSFAIRSCSFSRIIFRVCFFNLSVGVVQLRFSI